MESSLFDLILQILITALIFVGAIVAMVKWRTGIEQTVTLLRSILEDQKRHPAYFVLFYLFAWFVVAVLSGLSLVYFVLNSSSTQPERF